LKKVLQQALFMGKHDQKIDFFLLDGFQISLVGSLPRTGSFMDMPFVFSASTSSDNCRWYRREAFNTPFHWTGSSRSGP
jgi:hypothetical protein